jgi:5-(carboxyamino)imidazole ribonucleotide mutase
LGIRDSRGVRSEFSASRAQAAGNELFTAGLHSSLDTRHVALFTARDMKSGPLVAVIMGSKSDWETMKHAVEMLERFGIAHEARVVSAHRTPVRMVDFAREAAGRGIQVIVAGAGGAAHLPGMVAAFTHLPVLGVPVQSRALKGLDSLLSIAQMPAGIPVGTLAIGEAGAKNAGLLAAGIIALHDERVRKKLLAFRKKQTADVMGAKLP